MYYNAVNFDKVLRASGRTTKLANEVEEVSKTTKAIFVVPDSMLREFSLRFKGNDNVVVLSDLNSSIDWDTMQVRGMRAYEVYFDHAVIYKRFGVQIQKYLEACHIKLVSN